MNFQKLGVANWLAKICDKIGYNDPTDVQKTAIPSILKEENVVSIN